MKKTHFTTVLLICLSIMSFSQPLTTTVRGTVIDSDSKLPLAGIIVIVLNSDPLLGTTSDEKGEFRLDNVPVGRISLKLSYIGYESMALPDIEINSGKERILTISMQESVIKLDEVTVVANKESGAPINDMSVVSTRSISTEDSKRYAGSFNDPSKVLSNFAGVTHSQNGQNDIIVRGNSPKYVQWRLEGVEISNPTHFADQNSIKGGISALNNSLMATSDFSTSAFAPEYGNVISAVYDAKLRAGNNQKMESSFGIGILGTELTMEGPFKKGYGGSFLINYRYSTISLISQLGLIKADGVLSYQDATFKVVLPTKKWGEFSCWGLGGKDGFYAKAVKPEVTTTPSNSTSPADIKEDYQKGTFMANTGMNHTLPITNRGMLTTTLAYTNNGITEDIYKIKTTKIYDQEGNYLHDSIGDKREYYKSRLLKSTYVTAVSYQHKFNARNTLQVGTRYTLYQYDYSLSMLQGSPPAWFDAVNTHKYIGTWRNFVSWKVRVGKRLTFVSGFQNMNVLYNHQSTLEPRIAVSWRLNNTNTLTAGYGKHSTIESIHNYFTRVSLSNGNVAEPNTQLDLIKAHHLVLGYENRFTESLRLKTEIYYQYLYNLPVENVDTSYYATLTEGTDYRYVPLVNKGTGKNVGIELTLERFFANTYYFLFNGSLYSSTYKPLDGVERNTPYNGNYLVNLLGGKEIERLGRKNNQTLTLNAKVFFGGGQKYIPLLRDEKGNVAVDPANNRYWDYNKAYNQSLSNIYQITLFASYKWNKPKATHELFINLDNLTNNTAHLTEYYDPSKPNSVGYIDQFGFFPNLMYRIYF